MRDFVEEQLDLVSVDIKVLKKSDYALVQCPFHKDGQESNPSLMVNLGNPKYDVGFYYCLSCGSQGSWNKLAQELSLEEIVNNSPRQRLLPKKLQVNSLKIKPVILEKDISPSISWPQQDSWRGIKGSLLQQIYARLRVDFRSKDKQIVLPVSINRRVVGYIYGYLQKRDKELGSSYINSKGAWVKDALFPFDYAVSLVKKDSTLPLYVVEGPRDALNLLQHGLPAVAILGCTNWSKSLLPLLSTVKASSFIVLMDGDEAGKTAAINIYHDLLTTFPKSKVQVYDLPNNMDPADLDLKASQLLLQTYKHNLNNS
jgi:hypothetical protein